jgi:uncharacterized protein
MTFLKCPVCAGEMREQERQGVTIDVCSQCRGVWLDRGELEKLASAVATGAPQQFASMDPARDQPSGRQAAAPQDMQRGRQRRDDDDDDDEGGGFFGGNRRRSGGGGRGLLDFFD